MYFSPKTANDGLVFHYDTGNTVRSYKGEPTVNLVTNPDFATGNYSGWSSTGVGGAVEITGVFSENGYNYFHKKVNKVTAGALDRITQSSVYTINTSLQTTVTFDIWINPLNAYGITFYGLGSTADDTTYDEKPLTSNGTTVKTVSLGGGWNRYIYTLSTAWYTGTGSTFRVAVYPDYGGTGLLEYKLRRVQVEQKSHATPFVNGTRSATQGLLDLTSGNGLDLTDTSFNSNAEVDFDGTSGLMYSPELPVLDSFTLEVIFKPDTIGGWMLYRNSSMNYTGNADNFTLGFTSGKLYGAVEYDPSGADVYVVGTSNILTSQYSHGVFTYDNSTKTLKIYVNGELENTTVHSGDNYPYRSTKKMSIGADGGSNHGGIGGNKYFFNGQIPVTKVYNRALTSDEIRRNYNSLKSRFNI